MSTRKALVESFIARYKKAAKKTKTILLNGFVDATGFNRCYARRILRLGHKKQKSLGPSDSPIIGRGRKKYYTPDVLAALKKIWQILRFACGKRLVPAMPEMIRVLEKFGEIHFSKETKKKLSTMSTATADRLLKPEREKFQLKGRSGTKPGSLLKHKIPVRTFADWKSVQVGFFQIDLVSHEGGNASGDFAHTLDITDVASGWTEPEAIQNKARVWVVEALDNIRKRLPFPMLGVNSDNGSEFLNAHLLQYSQKYKINFTRGRSDKKNDNCYIEQKNYVAVRELVGYYRYDTAQELVLLNKLYALYRLYANFFQPQMKLLEKVRVGSKVSKKYDAPLTPYARLLASSHLSDFVKEKLRIQYNTINPAKLLRDIVALQESLRKCATLKEDLRRAELPNKEEQIYAHAS